jgi:hydrogenase maturation factor
MEICGGQTHTIMHYGTDELLPRGVEIVHGLGCPVCATPLETVDKAIAPALRPDVILFSYGDRLHGPGSHSDLFRAKAPGADVRIGYSPIEALKTARANPGRKVIFLAIGSKRPPLRTPGPPGKPGAKISPALPHPDSAYNQVSIFQFAQKYPNARQLPASNVF